MRKAFTLAEVLITLSIVGVIAILTVPNLIVNMHEKTYSSLLQNTFLQLSDAMREAIAEQKIIGAEDINRYVDNCSDAREQCFIEKYMNKISTYNNPTEYFGSSYKTLEGADIADADLFGTDSDNNYNIYAKLKNGVAIGLKLPISEDDEAWDGEVIVDVNGAKQPNILGKDLYTFKIKSNTDMGSSKTYDSLDDAREACRSFGEDRGVACFQYLTENDWKIDY